MAGAVACEVAAEASARLRISFRPMMFPGAATTAEEGADVDGVLRELCSGTAVDGVLNILRCCIAGMAVADEPEKLCSVAELLGAYC